MTGPRGILRRLVVLSLLLAAAAPAAELNQGLSAGSLSELLPWAQFDPAVPGQLAATGVAPAARPLRPQEVLDYFRTLAEASPHARLIEYARSHEGRPLVLLAVSDAATIADLDGFRARHAALLDGASAAVAADAKAVAWMAYGIHGDELSSTDAAVTLAHWLVAGTDDRARTLRERLLILIDPNENPDGRARYLAQTAAFAHRRANPDQDDLSHRGAWPWGRGNHYLFDINRDWFTQIHPESARSRHIAAWLPQLLVDSHEMGGDATYLFPPPRHPFNPHLPASARKWERPFSDAQAAALDARGFPYMTGEWNEEFFPGYGSSWVSYHGGVGILYEMSRTAGTLVRKRGGTVRTFAQAVEHQLTSSVANLTTLAENAGEVLSDQIAARAAAVAAGARGECRVWFFPPDPRRPQRLERFAALLDGQGIRVEVLGRGGVRAKGLRDIRDGGERDLELPAGTLRVRLDQPAGRLARVLLDPHVPMDAVFFRDEREYLEMGKGSRLYETTAWSLPLCRGLPAFWAGSSSAGAWTAWTPAAAPVAAGLPQEPYTSLVLDLDPDAAPAALAALLQAGVTVRIAEKPFRVAGHDFPRGAAVIRREGNRDDLDAVLARIAAEHPLPLLPVGTSRAQEGPDLGGSHFPVLVPPRVGVLTGMPVSPSDYGSVWHLLDQTLDLRFSALDIARFGRLDLSRYNVLVFPPVMGGSAMYRQLLGERGLERLKGWIEAGGTAVGLAGGARWLADPASGLTVTRFRAEALDEYPSPVWSIDAAAARDAGRPAAVGLFAAAAAKPGEKAAPPAAARDASPFDVAPLLGPGAAPFAAGTDQGTPLGGQPVRLADWVRPVLAPGRKEPAPEDLAAADARLRQFMPQGALLRAELDPESWLNYGLDAEITVWLGQDDTMIAAPPTTVAARFAPIERLHLGGLLWPEAAARTARTGFAVREAVGRGQIILFADHPAYRRWLAESERLLINAVLLGPGLGTRWSAPW